MIEQTQPATNAVSSIPPAQPVRLARTALWVHGLGLLFLVAAFGFFAVLGGSRDAFTVLGVGGAAWFALTIWSLIIGVNSWRQGERSRLRTLLWMTALFESSVVLLAFLVFDYTRWPIWFSNRGLRWVVDAVFEMCLPVLLPTLFVSLCVALPLSKRLAGRIERRRWIVAIVAVLVLPWAIVPYCVKSWSEGEAGRYGVRYAIATHTPVFICDLEEGIYRQTPWALGRGLFERRMLRLVSKERLQERLQERLFDSDSDIVFCASASFIQRFPEEATARAVELSSRDAASKNASNRQWLFGNKFGRSATAAEIRKVIDDKAIPHIFRINVISSQAPKLEFLTDVLRLAAEDGESFNLTDGFCTDQPGKEFLEVYRREWMKIFEEQNLPHREELADVAVYCKAFAVTSDLVERCLNDADPATRYHAVAALANRIDQPWRGDSSEEGKLLLIALDNADIVVPPHSRTGPGRSFENQCQTDTDSDRTEICAGFRSASAGGRRRERARDGARRGEEVAFGRRALIVSETQASPGKHLDNCASDMVLTLSNKLKVIR